MEPQRFDTNQAPSESLDPFDPLSFEFPLPLLLTDQDFQWTGFDSSFPRPGSWSYIDENTPAEVAPIDDPPPLHLQDSDIPQDDSQPFLIESQHAQISPIVVAVEEHPSPESPNHDYVEDEDALQHGTENRSYSASVWNDQRPHIKRIYMDELRSLGDTMKYMAENHDFRPSKKMYKDKFNEWGWHKYLPSAMALWMFHKWEKRMREMNTDTRFELGGRTWTSAQVLKRVKRAASQRPDESSGDMTTPLEVTYSTPHTIASRNRTPTPGVAIVSPPGGMASSVVSRRTDRWTPFPMAQARRSHQLATRWQNYSRTDLDVLRKEAQELARQGKNMEAERRFREALAGLENLLPPTHDDTNSAAYQLAAFYAQHGRMKEADAVLGRVGEHHLEHWGINHKKTRSHIHRVADLYHSWDRQSDAIAFLCRAYSFYDRLFNSSAAGEPNSSSLGSQPVIIGTVPTQPIRIQSVEPTAPDEEAGTTNEAYGDQSSTGAVIKVEEPESTSLLNLIDQFERYPESLGEETLLSHRTAINYCRAQQNEALLTEALDKSAQAFRKIFDASEPKSKAVIEAAVELAKSHLLSGKDESAGDMFLQIESEADESLGPDDHNTIAILIDIGKFYQDQQRWTDACPWFEHAFAASITKNGLGNHLTQRLEAALDAEYYDVSFPSSEAYEQSLRRNCFPSQISSSFY